MKKKTTEIIATLTPNGVELTENGVLQVRFKYPKKLRKYFEQRGKLANNEDV